MSIIKWHKLLDIPAIVDGSILTYTLQEYSMNVNQFKKYIPKEYSNATVFRFKNKRVIVVKNEGETFEVIVQKYEVVPDEQKEHMLNNGWVYIGRNVWYHRMGFRRDTMWAITIAFERLKNVDVKQPVNQ